MRVRVGAVEGTPPARRFIQVGHPQRLIESRNWGLEGPAISTHQVTGTIDNPETIEIPLEVTSDTIREFAVQEKAAEQRKPQSTLGCAQQAQGSKRLWPPTSYLD